MSRINRFFGMMEQGMRTGQAGALSARDAALKKLLQGEQQAHDMAKVERGGELANERQAANLDRAQALTGKGGAFENRSLNLADDGGVSVGDKDPLTALLRAQTFNNAREDKTDAKLTRFGDRVAKANLPQSMSALANLEAGTRSLGADGKPAGGLLSNPNYEVKSAGPVANALPQFVKNIGEKVGLMPEGASQESALVQRLMNMDIRNMSGTAVSTYEQGRQNVEKCLSIGGDPELDQQG